MREIELNTLQDLMTAQVTALGAPEDEVAATVDMCIDAELRGHRSHGVRLLRNIAREYKAGAGRRRPLSVVDETPSSAVIDGGYHLSPYVHRQAVDLLIEKAQNAAIAIVTVRAAGVSGALGYLVERIARRGLVGIALNSTPLVVVAPGATEPSLGTNPIGFAVPRPHGDPLVLDMATSAIAFNEVMRRRATGELLPPGVALNSQGEPTQDPNAVVREDGRGRVLPFGGHRGFGLALMVELLASCLATGRSAETKRGTQVHEPDDFGAVYIAVDPRALGAGDSGLAAVEDLIQEIEAGGGRLPGEHSRILRDSSLTAGTIALDADAQEVLGLQR